MLQAGDLVPEVRFTKVMRSPGDQGWRHQNLLGRVTVIVFFANVYDATEAFASHWNELVERFADKQVQFVLIARDDKSELEAWLQRYPLAGWVLVDPNWDTRRNWDILMPQIVFVSTEAKILGFSHGILPFESQIEAILDGRVNKAGLRTKPHSPGGDKPDVPPSYTVHISPTKREPEEGTSSSSGPEHWTALGFELKAVVAQVYGIDESRIEGRIDFPAALDNGDRYDFELLLPREESRETMHRLVQQAIEQYFQLTITRETRRMDVYVLTAPEGAGPALQEGGVGGGFLGTSSLWHSPSGNPPTIEELRKARAPLHTLSGSGMEIAELCSAIERSLDRPVVDETGLEGFYDFQVSSGGVSNEDFFQALRENLGLVATAGERDVTMLVVRQT